MQVGWMKQPDNSVDHNALPMYANHLASCHFQARRDPPPGVNSAMKRWPENAPPHLTDARHPATHFPQGDNEMTKEVDKAKRMALSECAGIGQDFTSQLLSTAQPANRVTTKLSQTAAKALGRRPPQNKITDDDKAINNRKMTKQQT